MAFTEHVIPANGRRESFWVLGTVATILLAGALALPENQSTPESIQTTQTSELNIKEKQLVMDLSTALPEIRFEHEISGTLPSLSSLAELGIAPFASTLAPSWRWSQPEATCYLGKPSDENLGYFMLLPASGGIYFAKKPHHSTRCQPNHDWVRLDTNEESQP